MYIVFAFLSVSNQASIIDLIKQFWEILKNPPNCIPDYLVGVFWALLLVIIAFVIICIVTKKRPPKQGVKFKFYLKVSKGEDNSTNDN